ncbi:Adenylyltransferase and sulfurtransferase MOCS3/Uba4 [Trinorchestia longiramus]|nr:Adenylyltransferase and sulfurtransferase MOCS3/Uba4 [Trinorchestia longiramus]
MNDSVEELKASVLQKEKELSELRVRLASLRSSTLAGQNRGPPCDGSPSSSSQIGGPTGHDTPPGDVGSQVPSNFHGCPSSVLGLSHTEVARYSRQLILPELGVAGQKKLKEARVLIVGCGGLGCPSAQYLAAAGVGTLGLLDYDDVEVSNLHRQVLHSEARVGMSKVDSIIASLYSLNSNVRFEPHKLILNSVTAMPVIEAYDIVLDCTDNVATRYLLNDACVISNKPLVSGAALRFEGQLTIYHYDGGPCYRCLFPSPPPPETVTNCSDGGVVGVVPGIIGSMQGLETIKLITGVGKPLSNTMLVFDGYASVFRNVKLRPRQTNCAVCGDLPSITQLIDYVQFCGASATDKDTGVSLLTPAQRVTVKEYESIVSSGEPHVLVDVRQPVELGICVLNNTVNIPLKEISKPERVQEIRDALESCEGRRVICVCRRGNDSQLATVALKEALKEALPEVIVQDIAGGLTQWARVIDNSMPIY